MIKLGKMHLWAKGKTSLEKCFIFKPNFTYLRYTTLQLPQKILLAIEILLFIIHNIELYYEAFVLNLV